MLQAMQSEYVKLLTNAMYDVQSVRKALDNRIGAFLRNGGEEYEEMADDLKHRLSDLAHKMESNIEKDLGKAVAKMPVIKWLEMVRGIGPRLSGSLVGMLAPIDRFPTVSALWSYCGQGVLTVCLDCNRQVLSGKEKARFLDRQAERRWEIHQLKEEKSLVDETDFLLTAYADSEKKLCQCDTPNIGHVAPKRQYYKGLLLNFNPFLKMTCWKIAGQFIKQGKFYRQHYEKQKEYYTARDGGRLAKGHIDNRARRATVKLFLSHLWEMWRKAEGLPSGEIYLQHHLGEEFAAAHTLIKPPHHSVFD